MSKRRQSIKRRIATLFVAAVSGLALWAVTVTPVAASCSQAYVDLWESPDYSGDGLRVCYATNLPDLRNVTHTQAGICAAVFKFDDNWNDCINSAQYHELTVNTSVCLYVDTNYNGNGVKFTNNGAQGNWAFGIFSDSFSSVLWGNLCDA